jgi:Prohead core protein serine protease
LTSAKTQLLNITQLDGNQVFIIERVNEALSVSKEKDGALVLEGICAVFGQRNENNRIYEKQEYLPHLNYLTEKINKGQLFGELDHPQSFDVSLKNVSHVVESLRYDEPSNTVRIKLRVLDTPCGRIAKTLVESGCTISTSSRAAGQVSESGKVKLHKIFTYDLVAEPGFSQAALSQVSESLKHNYSNLFESLDNLKCTSITNQLTDISEKFNFEDSVKVYRINNSEINTQNNNNQMANDFVSREEMNQYSQLVKRKFDSLQENLSKNEAGLQSLNESNGTALETDKLVEYVNYLASELEKVVEYSNYLSTMLNKGISYTEHVAEKVNSVIDYSDYLAETVEKNIHYSDYLGEKVNQSINYGEYVAEAVEKNIAYSNYLAENVDKGIQYAEYVAENAEKGIKYSNYLAENLDAAIKYSEYIGENLQKGIAYSEYLAESMNEKLTPNAGAKTRRLLDDVKKLNESIEISVDEASGVDELVDAVDGILAHIKSNSANTVLENKYPFLKLLSESNKQKFYALEPTMKTAIVETMKGAVYFTEAEVINLMEAVMNVETENTPAYIKFMPEKYKTIFENMTEGELNWIAAQASTVKIATPYQAKAFWDSRDLRGINERIAQAANINNQEINEGQGKEGYVSLKEVNENLRGYSSNYLEMLKRRAQN